MRLCIRLLVARLRHHLKTQGVRIFKSSQAAAHAVPIIEFVGRFPICDQDQSLAEHRPERTLAVTRVNAFGGFCLQRFAQVAEISAGVIGRLFRFAERIGKPSQFRFLQCEDIQYSLDFSSRSAVAELAAMLGLERWFFGQGIP